MFIQLLNKEIANRLEFVEVFEVDYNINVKLKLTFNSLK